MCGELHTKTIDLAPDGLFVHQAFNCGSTVTAEVIRVRELRSHSICNRQLSGRSVGDKTRFGQDRQIRLKSNRYCSAKSESDRSVCGKASVRSEMGGPNGKKLVRVSVDDVGAVCSKVVAGFI